MKKLFFGFLLLSNIYFETHAGLITFPDEQTLIERLGDDYEYFNEKTSLAEKLANQELDLSTFKHIVTKALHTYYHDTPSMDTIVTMKLSEKELFSILLTDYPEELKALN